LTGVAATALLTGCATGGGSLNEVFFYCLTNAIPDVSSVDLFADKTQQFSLVGFGAASTTAFIETDLEEPVIFYDLYEGGTSNPIDSISVDKNDEQSVHLFALGAFTATPGNLQPIARLVPVTVDRRTPQGNARIVFVHGYVRAAGTQTPNVDLMLQGTPTPVQADVAFADSRVFTRPAGTYTFEVRIAGLLSGTFLTNQVITLQANKVYIFMLQGLEGGAGPIAPKIEVYEEPIHDP
jgi:hypothetical protein